MTAEPSCAGPPLAQPAQAASASSTQNAHRARALRKKAVSIRSASRRVALGATARPVRSAGSATRTLIPHARGSQCALTSWVARASKARRAQRSTGSPSVESATAPSILHATARTSAHAIRSAAPGTHADPSTTTAGNCAAYAAEPSRRAPALLTTHSLLFV